MGGGGTLMMEGLQRAGCRPAVQTSLSAGAACSYGMGRFLPRSTPFTDCMQGVGTYPSYSTDWNLMQGMYSHPSLPMERAGNTFRTSSAYYPVTHSNKDLPPPAHTGDSPTPVTGGTAPSPALDTVLRSSACPHGLFNTSVPPGPH